MLLIVIIYIMYNNNIIGIIILYAESTARRIPSRIKPDHPPAAPPTLA